MAPAGPVRGLDSADVVGGLRERAVKRQSPRHGDSKQEEELGMTALEGIPTLGPIARYEKEVDDRITDFNDPRQEWRRLFSELLGTFFLVLVAAAVA